jgi:hypothetical protein
MPERVALPAQHLFKRLIVVAVRLILESELSVDE